MTSIILTHSIGRISLYKVTANTKNLNKVLRPYVAAYIGPVAACGAVSLICQDDFEREQSVNGILCLVLLLRKDQLS